MVYIERMPIAFRENPPLEFVKRFLELYGIYDIDNGTWFTKDQCSLNKASALLLEVHPYYIPCKATFIDNIPTYIICFKVLRHILKAHGYSLSYIEKSRGVKQVWYKIVSMGQASLPKEGTLISFE